MASPLKIGDRVRPAGKGGPPWREGVVETIAPRLIKMPIGVRLTDAALGYQGSVAYFAAEELERVSEPPPRS